MSPRNCLTLSLCLLALFFAVSVSAQDKSLNDAKTFDDIGKYLKQEMDKLDRNAPGYRLAMADILMPTGEKLLAIAQNDLEKKSAYGFQISALNYRIEANVEGAKEKYEALLKELDTHPEPAMRNFGALQRFNQFSSKSMSAPVTPENFDAFKTEFKTWLNQKDYPVTSIAPLGIRVAERYKVPVDQFVKELSEYVQSPECTVPEERKRNVIAALEGVSRLALGNDPKLYGKTLDDKDFKWADLRGKYVLIKFTATWCGPCALEVPGMLEAYEKYHDKGFEIVSVYIGQREDDPVAVVKKHVEEKKLPWIIISEELSKQAKLPEFGAAYGIMGIPTMVLVDKDGKIIMMNARGSQLQTKLAEIFE